jgi:predicted methyltransferase
MKRFLPLLMLAVLAAGQVATEANSEYRTKEGRGRMAGMMGGPGRDALQKPKDLMQALEMKPGMTVVDLGTGAGYLLPYLSAAVGPSGKVVAEDIFQDFLDKAKERAKKENLQNVSFVLGTDKNPNLGEISADIVLILEAYHHFDYPEKTLAGIRTALKKDGRLVIVDYYKRSGAMPGSDPGRALKHVRLDAGDVIREVELQGFRIHTLRPFLPGAQYLAVFEKK